MTIPGAAPYMHEGTSGTAFLALHGWAASAESMRFLAYGLAEAGHAVLAPTLPGHGSSPDDMVRFGPVDWSAAACEGLILLRHRFARVFVLGASMGGALALQLAAAVPDALEGIITVNAPVFMNQPEFAREIVSAPATASLSGWHVPAFKGPVVPEISYPDRRKKSGADLYAMCALARESLPLITSPILAFQAVSDPVVPKDCAEEIFARVNSTRKRLIWLEESYHVAQLDLDRDRIVRETLDFARMAISA